MPIYNIFPLTIFKTKIELSNDEKNKMDWNGIEKFYRDESYKGYPFSECSVDKWGFEFI
mgnify:CR=1 FL=1